MEIAKTEYSFYEAVRLTKLHDVGYNKVLAGRFEKLKFGGYTFIYNDGGRFGAIFGNKIVWLAEGEGAFISPNTEFTPVMEGESVNIFHAVFEAEERFASVPTGTNIPISVFGKALLSELTSAAREVYGENASGNEISSDKLNFTQLRIIPETLDASTGQRIKNCLELFVINCIKPAYKPFKARFEETSYANESEKLADKINSYLAANLNKTITLEEVSATLFFSASYVKKAYKKITGKSVLYAHAEMRIKEAERLLLNGMSAKKVAETLGFNSPNYFSAVFKKFTGTTPYKYRKTIAASY